MRNSHRSAYSHALAGGTTEYSRSCDYSVLFGNGDTALSGGTAIAAGNYDVVHGEGNNPGTVTAQGADYLVEIDKCYGPTAPAAVTSPHF